MANKETDDVNLDWVTLLLQEVTQFAGIEQAVFKSVRDCNDDAGLTATGQLFSGQEHRV